MIDLFGAIRAADIANQHGLSRYIMASGLSTRCSSARYLSTK